MKPRFVRPSPALLVAVAALVVAMCGTAIAAVSAGDSLIAKRSLSGNRLRYNTVTGTEVSESSLRTVPRAKLASTLPALVWHNLTLVNNWVNHESAGGREPAWARDAQGIVHLRGGIQQDPVGGSTKFATLPSAARPAQLSVALAAVMNGGKTGEVLINPDGTMFAQHPDGTSAQGFTSLEGLTYSVH